MKNKGKKKHRNFNPYNFADRVVDELNPQMNLTKKEVETLLEFDADADDMPYEDFSNLSEKFTDPMLSNICNNFSNFLSKVRFKVSTGYFVNLPRWEKLWIKVPQHHSTPPHGLNIEEGND